MPDQMKLLVGTRKGAFIYTSDRKRQRWQLSEPILPGWSFYHMAADLRNDPPRFYAAVNHWAWGRSVAKSADLGKTWEPLTNGLPGPRDYQSVYREGLDTDGLDPEGVYVGTSNGQVYASSDGGDSWQRLPGSLPPILSVGCAVF
jgi:hypothetical protein